MATSEYLKRVIRIQLRDRESGHKTIYTSPGASRLISHAQRLEEMVELLRAEVLDVRNVSPETAEAIDKVLAATDLKAGS